jgi:hypothetical protein
VLAACAGLCVAIEFAHQAPRNAIRIDLFVTLPGIALGALALGIASLSAARTTATALIVLAGGSLAWLAWSMAGSAREAVRLSRIVDEANRLYWQETSRCETNFAARFGSYGSRDHPCRGHFRVASRAAGAYPFTRIVVNNAGHAYLLFSPHSDVEVNFSLDDGPLAEVRLAGGSLKGPCKDTTRCRDVSLEALPDGGCEARVTGNVRDSVLTLERAALPACDTAPGAVRSLGVYAQMFSTTSIPPLRQLVQLWLWETAERVRGLLLVAEGYPGQETQFNFVKPLEGSRSGESKWTLEVIDLQGRRSGARLTVAVGIDQIAISGDAVLFRTEDGNRLPPQQFVNHPKIALIPLRDEASFTQYFDNVLHNLSVPWVVP